MNQPGAIVDACTVHCRAAFRIELKGGGGGGGGEQKLDSLNRRANAL